MTEDETEQAEILYAALKFVECRPDEGTKYVGWRPDRWSEVARVLYRALKDQCAAAGVPFFFKQWGEWAEIDGPKTRGGPVSRQERGPHVQWMERNGDLHPHTDWRFSPYGNYLMACVGKKRAGRLLDGVTHDGWPT